MRGFIAVLGANAMLALVACRGSWAGVRPEDRPPVRSENLLPSSERASAWGVSSTSWAVADDVATAPDGSRTADLIRRIDPAPAVLRRPLQGFPATSIAYGVCIKAAGGSDGPGPLFFAIRNDTAGQLLAVAECDPSSGTFAVKSGKGDATPLQDGWIRVCLSADSGVAIGDTVAVYFGSGHDQVPVATGFLVWGMQLGSGPTCGPYLRTDVAAVTIESSGEPPRSTTDAPPVPVPAPPPPAALPAPLGVAPAPRDLSQRMPALLAASWLRDLRSLAIARGADREVTAACIDLAARAARLAPDRRESWDVVLGLAQRGVRDGIRSATAARAEALAAMARIDPADDAVRLARIEAAVATQRSADAQAKALETMLDARNRVAIGDAVAARLALLLSKLESSRGNVAAASRWLRESVAIDPAYLAARRASADASPLAALPARALEVEMRPVAQALQPLEPLRLSIRVRNASGAPLAIGGDGAIDGVALLRSEFMSDGTPVAAGGASDSVGIDRRLRLAPGEELAFELDATGTAIGRAVESDPLRSQVLRCSLAINASASQGGAARGAAATPGNASTAAITAVAPHVQLAGVDVSPDWARESLAYLGEPAASECARRVVLLAHALSRDGVPPEVWACDRWLWWDALVKAWKALPPMARAWTVGVLPRSSPGMQPLLEAVRADTSPEVLQSRVLVFGMADDPAAAKACLASGDAALARLAEALSGGAGNGGNALVAPDGR